VHSKITDNFIKIKLKKLFISRIYLAKLVKKSFRTFWS